MKINNFHYSSNKIVNSKIKYPIFRQHTEKSEHTCSIRTSVFQSSSKNKRPNPSFNGNKPFFTAPFQNNTDILQ
jgi:hypothetical protein